jgi:hypothetical protein
MTQREAKREAKREEYLTRLAITMALNEAKADVILQLKRQGRYAREFEAKEIHQRAWALLEAERQARLEAAVARLIKSLHPN